MLAEIRDAYSFLKNKLVFIGYLLIRFVICLRKILAEKKIVTLR